MKRLIVYVTLGAASAALLCLSVTYHPEPETLTFHTYTVINTYPHDRTAFTQGLVYEDGILYEGTGLHNHSSLRKVELETGKILRKVDLPSHYFGEGITIYEDKIIQITWETHVGLVYDKETFELLSEFHYPTEGWGITFDGKRLIMSDGTSVLHFLDPETFEEIGKVEVYDEKGPVANINELEYIEGEIYANVWQTSTIARISPETGKVVGWIDLEGLLTPQERAQADVLNGIAYDQAHDRLFVTGKFWPFLFEIKLVPLPSKEHDSSESHPDFLTSLKTVSFPELFEVRASEIRTSHHHVPRFWSSLHSSSGFFSIAGTFLFCQI